VTASVRMAAIVRVMGVLHGLSAED
jgi:hypothetical protein